MPQVSATRAVASDGFGVGSTQAMLANTGPRVSEASLTLQAGDLTLTNAGTVVQDILLTGSAFVQAPNITIRRAIIDVPADTADRHGIYNWHASATGLQLIDVLIRCREANRSYWIGSGIHGSGFEATRVQIIGFTDGITMAGVGKRSYARAYGCYVGELMHYAYDGFLEGRQGSHSDGSHPDAIAVEGNLTEAIVQGCSLPLAYTSASFVTENQGTFDAAPQFLDNWYRNDGGGGGSYLNLSKSGMTSIASLGVVVKRNRFPNGTSPARMFVRPEYLSTMQANGQITSSGADRNTFSDGTGPVSLWNGTTNLTTY